MIKLLELKHFTCIATILSLFAAINKAKSQGIEFVENKGQWDKSIKFKGDINNGAFYLTETGYRVVVSSQDDMLQASEFYHGRSGAGNADSSNIHFTTSARAITDNTGRPGNASSGIIRSHAYEVSFMNTGASARAKTGNAVTMVGEKAMTSVNNYFIGNDRSKWASNCKVYQAVTYKNIYPNIDVRYYVDNGSLKYDLIVNPGADVNNIALKFDGVDKLDVKNQNLVIKTSVGEIAELQPYTFQASVNGRAEVSSKYTVSNDNVVKFRIGAYDKTQPLVIDPTMVFSSFAGSRDDNWGYSATYDGAGNMYGGGIVFGPGFPVSNGAFQTKWGGGSDDDIFAAVDIGIIKLTPNGTQRLYATYLGGNGNEQPHSMIVDNNGDLIVAGRTTSSNFPTTQDKYGTGTPAQGTDIFITKFNSTGSAIIGSRLFGGTGLDGVNIAPKYASSPEGAFDTRRNYGDDSRSEVMIDGQNNIYLASCTQSKDFPTTSNAFQTKNAGGQDGVFIKTNSDLSTVLTSTYFGGSGNDAAFVLAIDPLSSNILVGGATRSTDFPGVGNGAVISKVNNGGECDGFVSLLSSSGSLIKTTYAGTGGHDLVYGVQYDKFGYPYIMGTTTGDWPTTSNVGYKDKGGKQFIAKLKKDLSGWEYSTTFGSGLDNPDISPVAFLVDRCENVYVSGWGGSANTAMKYKSAGTINLKITSDAIQRTTDGSDFYFFVLKKDATQQLYGSYFGQKGGFGEHVDGGTSRFDKQGVIYMAMCANCMKSGAFPTMPGNVWSPSNPAASGSKCNLAMVKIAFELAGVGTGVRSAIDGIIRDTAGCVPLTVDFKDTIAIAKQYIWSFGDGTKKDTTTIAQISHTYNQIGLYRVMLVAIDSSSCNVADTSYMNILVRKDRAILNTSYTKLLPCDSLKYEFENNSTAPPGMSFGSNSFIWDFGDGSPTITTGLGTVQHSYAAPGKYNILLKMVDTTFCNYPETDSIILRIASNVKAQFTTPPSGCAPYDAVFTNTSLAGQQYQWDFGDGTTSTEESPVHTYPKPGNYSIKLVVIDSSTCNKIDSFKYNIVVSPKPTAAFTYTPTQAEPNSPFYFSNNSINATNYKWLFGDGDSLATVKTQPPVSHIFNSSGNFRVTLIASNPYKCYDTAYQTLQALVIPLVDVPNAFTPNGDGINDQVKVRGYGIDKMSFKVFNRWGTLMFQSASQDLGWDGKFKGQLQQQDVYTYVLDVIFFDGTKYQKKGDITLLK
ncbi:PKD domain-containing protein [Danxiaibacter flavus]|uniref:PKD domain-containing protein n=1 Tax=Danxiaibacter flavus TaxID=3049108 RepID=A0ABV3ZPC9_9BACT|nr:PKD domain-containing protein [Chitinophagaceae bacterium DXS]